MPVRATSKYTESRFHNTSTLSSILISRHSHAYTHLPLLPLEAYLEAFPDQSHLEEPDLMPRRIEHEKQEREKLEQERQELLKTKEKLLKVNLKKKDDLKKMDEQLERTIEGLAPINESLTKDI